MEHIVQHAHLVRYAMATIMSVIIVARNVEESKERLTKSWLEDIGRKLATEKTELIFLTKKFIPLQIDITTCNTTLATRKVVNYFAI